MNTTMPEVRGIAVIKKMDKMLVIIIVFLVVSFLLAAILAMSAIPQIFKSAEKINQTQEIINQTQLQLHEDEAREKQKFEIIRETNRSMNKSLNNLENRFYQFVNESQIRSEKGQQERQKIIDDILNISRQHDKVAKDHDMIQISVENTTKQTYDLLKMAAQRNWNTTLENQEILVNLTKEIDEIKTMHKDILDILKQQTNK